MSSLTDTLARLTTLARDHGATLVHQVQLELYGGEGLLVFWEAHPDSDDLPRQALLRFSLESDVHTAATFTSAFVYSGPRFIHCLDEGLDETTARRESRQLVASIDQVCAYLTGQPYKVIPRGWWQAPYSALDTETEAD